jgi:hypothetical protein
MGRGHLPIKDPFSRCGELRRTELVECVEPGFKGRKAESMVGIQYFESRQIKAS